MSEVFIVFISKHSQACRGIKQQLDYISPHFNTRIVDIDNIHIRRSILNATKYKIESVPSIVLLYPGNGKIEKHEGQQVIELLNKGVAMVQSKLQAQQQKASSKARELDEETRETSHSDIEEILESSEEGFDFEGEEEEQPVVDRKRKIGKTTLFPDKRFAPTDDEGMIGGMKHLPRREDHTDMEQSSLPHMEQRSVTDRNRNYPPNSERQTGGAKRINTKIGKKSMVIEDLTDIPEKPEGMSTEDILGQDRGGQVRSKENDQKSKMMREKQDSILAERAAMEESEMAHIRQRRGM
jgi:hypothetical protein